MTLLLPGLGGSSGGGGGAADFALLDSNVLSAGATEVDFTGLSQSYGVLKIIGRVRSNRASSTAYLGVQFGGSGGFDTGLNYDTALFESNSSTAWNAATVQNADAGELQNIAGNSAAANFFTPFEIIIPNYTDTSEHKDALFHFSWVDGASPKGVVSGTVHWTDTSNAIERIRFRSELDAGTEELMAGSAFYVFGLGVL